VDTKTLRFGYHFGLDAHEGDGWYRRQLSQGQPQVHAAVRCRLSELRYNNRENADIIGSTIAGC